jgi:uncharacterized protein
MQMIFQDTCDRVGLGWRPELGFEILNKIENFDVLEITAESCFGMTNSELKAFTRLGAHLEIVVHALSLGLASLYPVSQLHLGKVARVVNAVKPKCWSEHLAFVRTDRIELGHLAAPPWCEEVVDAACENLLIARKTIGSVPHLENIATLYYPPASTMSEPEWVSQIIRSVGANLLIDIENIYANCLNLGGDPIEEMLKFPIDTVHYVHISGGIEVSDQEGCYFIDDHKHNVSSNVFLMLEHLASKVSQPLTIILERDGNFPNFEIIQEELEKARKALKAGRKLARAA